MAPSTKDPPGGWGGGRRAFAWGGAPTATSLRRDDRLHVRGHALVHLDRDHVGTGGPDRLLERDLAPVDANAARLLDRVDDFLRGDRPEQATIFARGVRDGQDGLAQQLRVLARPLRGLPACPLRGLGAPLRLGDGPRGGWLGEPARRQVVAQVPWRDVDDLTAAAERVDVLEEDRLRHQRSATYGSRASSRARLIARASWLWWRRQQPVIRAERILPLSLIARRS